MSTIKLYLGAHKTASTYIQNLLYANRNFFEKKNLLILTPQILRKDYLPKFFQFCKNGELSKDLISIFNQKYKSIILSDENLIGVTEDFIRKDGIYPYTIKRIKCFKKLYKDYDIKFYFSIRNYFDFYNSIYSEIIRNYGFISIKEFKEKLDWKNNSWVTFIQEIEDTLGKDKMFIWDFSLIKNNLFTILNLLADINEKEFKFLQKDIKEKRIGLSLKAVKIMEEIYPVLQRQEYFSLLERINNQYSVNKRFKKVNVFSKEEEKFLKEKYEKDIKEIKKILNKNFFI